MRAEPSLRYSSVRAPDSSHWHHEVECIPPDAIFEHTDLVAQIVEKLPQASHMSLVAARYKRDARPITDWDPTDSLVIRRKGLLFGKNVFVEVGRLPAGTGLSSTLKDLWLQGDNETLIVTAWTTEALTRFLHERWLDDAEANTVNEHLMVGAVPWVASRGWDGLTLQVTSTTVDDRQFAALMAEMGHDNSRRVSTPPCDVALALLTKLQRRSRPGPRLT